MSSLPPSALPPPPSFGLPSHYPTWRPLQPEAIQAITDSEVRFTALGCPTAFGKSIITVASAIMAGLRVGILTHTKALEDQYMRQFGDFMPQMTEVRGQGNYRCLVANTTVQHGPCHTDGAACSLRASGCLYYDAVRAAQKAQIVVGNYSMWMAVHEHGEGLSPTGPAGTAGFAGLADKGMSKKFDLLVCDEADTLIDSLTSYLQYTVRRDRWDEINIHVPEEGSSYSRMMEWAHEALRAVEYWVRAGESGELPIPYRQKTWLREQHTGLNRILYTKGTEWVMEWAGATGGAGGTGNGAAGAVGEAVFSPVNPAPLAEQYLFMGIPRVVLMSGTMSRKLVELLQLGSEGKDWEMFEYPSPISADRRRVVHIRTCSMRAGRADYGLWAARNDQIIAARPDRRIMLHTVSHDRARQFLSRTHHKDRVISNLNMSTEQALQAFTRSKNGVLVSASFGRGFDLADDLCRCTIFAKVPFADTRNPLMAARKALDPEYPMWVAMAAFQQGMNRSIRNPKDWSEGFVTDDDFRFFWAQNRQFASGYFREAVEYGGIGQGRVHSEDLIPAPMNW